MGLVLLKESAAHISISLANVIKIIPWVGCFVQDWKNAKVTPIYKDDGDVNNEYDYHSISVIGDISKITEFLLSYQIIDFWEDMVLFKWINLLIWEDTKNNTN